MLPFADWVTLLAGALVLGAQQSQVASLPDGLLARPVTPASVALLVLDARSADVQQRLGEALRDARPEVRAMAARVVAVTGSSGLAWILGDVLSRESNARAAREEVPRAGYEAPMRQTADAAGRPARIMRPIVADVLTEIAAITGCRLGSDADYAAAFLTYRPY